MSTRPPIHPPGYDKDTYTVFVMCTNCGRGNSVKVPKKVFVKDYLKKKLKCTNCECVGTLVIDDE